MSKETDAILKDLQRRVIDLENGANAARGVVPKSSNGSGERLNVFGEDMLKAFGRIKNNPYQLQGEYLDGIKARPERKHLKWNLIEFAILIIGILVIGFIITR